MEAGREFQFLEVIDTNVLANEVVRHFSNLTAKECWESAKRVVRVKHALGEIIDFIFVFRANDAFGGIIDFISSKHGSIYKKYQKT